MSLVVKEGKMAEIIAWFIVKALCRKPKYTYDELRNQINHYLV